jgi:hypothetical protein
MGGRRRNQRVIREDGGVVIKTLVSMGGPKEFVKSPKEFKVKFLYQLNFLMEKPLVSNIHSHLHI